MTENKLPENLMLEADSHPSEYEDVPDLPPGQESDGYNVDGILAEDSIDGDGDADDSVMPRPEGDSHETSADDLRERLIGELPTTVIGNADPLRPENTDYPNVLYHGTRNGFDLDGSKDYRTAPNSTGARTGRGLYCAAPQVAKSFGGEDMVPIYPKEAKIVDLTDPQADQPLSADFRGAFTSFQERKLQEDADPVVDAARTYAGSANRGEGLVSPQEAADFASRTIAEQEQATGPMGFDEKRELRAKVQETFSRINTQQIMADPDTSLRTLFALHDPVNGPTKYTEKPAYNVATSLDFLVGELGIDGAKTIQTFEPKPAAEAPEDAGDWMDDDPAPEVDPQDFEDIDPDLWHGHVFWRLDKVGDKDLWEQRQEETADLGRAALQGSAPESAGTDAEHEPNQKLSGEFLLSAEDVQPVTQKLDSGETLLSQEDMSELVGGLDADQVDPYKLVSKLAEKSEDMAKLLGGQVGLVVENFRLHEHTQAVVGGFEKNYAQTLEPHERKVLRTALLLQDIGKSYATAMTGNKNNQTGYNTMVAKNLLDQVPEGMLSSNDKSLILGLIGQDIIGDALQGHTTPEEAREKFDTLATSLEPTDRATIERYAQIMYDCDARAYTSDARFVRADSGDVGTPRRPALNFLYLKPHGRVTRLKTTVQQRINDVVKR